MKCACGLEFGRKYLPKGIENFTKDIKNPEERREFERQVAIGITMRKHPRTKEPLCQFCFNKIK